MAALVSVMPPSEVRNAARAMSWARLGQLLLEPRFRRRRRRVMSDDDETADADDDAAAALVFLRQRLCKTVGLSVSEDALSGAP